MTEYTITPMKTPAEMDGKGYVHFKSWHETYIGLIDQTYLDHITAEACVANAHNWPDNILLAKDRDNVIGFIAYNAYRDDSLAETGEIYALYVLQKYQGQKVGYRLMNAAMEQLDKYNTVALWVLKKNEKAIHFYEKYGFKADGTESEIQLGTSATELRMIYKKTT